MVLWHGANVRPIVKPEQRMSNAAMVRRLKKLDCSRREAEDAVMVEVDVE